MQFTAICQGCNTYERLDGDYSVGCHRPGFTEGDTEEQRRGAWPRSPRLSVPLGSLLPAKPLPGDPGGQLTLPGEAHGSPHGAQPLERGVVQLLSDVQMLHLQARETTQLPTSLPPHPSRGALAPDLFTLASIGHPFPLPLGPSMREPRPPGTQSDGPQLSTQMWKHSHVNTGHGLTFKMHPTVGAIN